MKMAKAGTSRSGSLCCSSRHLFGTSSSTQIWCGKSNVTPFLLLTLLLGVLTGGALADDSALAPSPSNLVGATCQGGADCDFTNEGPLLTPGKVFTAYNNLRIQAGAERLCNSSLMLGWATSWVQTARDLGASCPIAEGGVGKLQGAVLDPVPACLLAAPTNVFTPAKYYRHTYMLMASGLPEHSEPMKVLEHLFSKPDKEAGSAFFNPYLTYGTFVLQDGYLAILLAQYTGSAAYDSCQLVNAQSVGGPPDTAILL